MFRKRPHQNAIDPPPIAADAKAVEILRVWDLPGGTQQLTLLTTWQDAGVWGLLLVDIARHAALAYAKEGRDPDIVLARMRAAFEAEWSEPTDVPKDITPPD